MASGFLRVQGNQIVNEDGVPVILRGAGLGGWMNMENFITGFPGHESQHREAMKEVLGHKKAEFFFDKFLENFFTAADAKFFATLGLNCIRIAFNYRHFEDDMNPRVLKTSGFKHLDRVVKLCADEGIYTILDMHALPGGQSQDWHSDNVSNYAAFWDYKDHQDRTIWLWEQIAARYKDNPWVAGYNPINEPCDPKHIRLPDFYNRLENRIRKVDEKHILFLDGNTFAMEWKGFDRILPNCAYSIHDYSKMGFPLGDPFKGIPEQIEQLEKQFVRKMEFQIKNNAVVWNGEFGPVYADPEKEDAASEINEQRYNLLETQLKIYEKHKVHWTIWLYKDIGFQGMMHTSPDSLWNRTVGPFVEKKRNLQLDAWGKYASKELEAILAPLVQWVDSVSPTAKATYPTPWSTIHHIQRAVLQTFVAQSMSLEFARLFEGMSLEELEECARSFHFDRCVQRHGLNRRLSSQNKLPN
ncbi:putative glucanase [Leptodontidium sp. 2 PMI_412]|nr:putative glucanase [Leptodontidium sp. 2 PMI_412]